MSNINDLMHSLGLIDLNELDPTIKSDIRYATPNNFTGKILYEETFGIFLEKRLANAVCAANNELKEMCEGYSLIIFDAARPLTIQKHMYDIVKDTPAESYVANPYTDYPGGFHNYGMAVDLSICDKYGALLDMGTDFDSFSEIAHVGNEQTLVANGLLSSTAYANRMLLYSIMGRYGMLPHPLEWWHYQLDYLETDKMQHPLLNF